MRLSRASSRKSRRISLTPLIDVVFLLLVFFMLSSTFLKFAHIPVKTAKEGSTQSAELSKVIVISVETGGVIKVDGEKVLLDDLVSKLDNLVIKGQDKAVIKPQDEVKLQIIVSVLQRVRRSQLKSVVVAQ